ncbi:hypothetical protein [Demequina sp.]
MPDGHSPKRPLSVSIRKPAPSLIFLATTADAVGPERIGRLS